MFIETNDRTSFIFPVASLWVLVIQLIIVVTAIIVIIRAVALRYSRHQSHQGIDQDNSHRPEKALSLDPGRFLSEGLILSHQVLESSLLAIVQGIAGLHFDVPYMLKSVLYKDKYKTGKGLFQLRLVFAHRVFVLRISLSGIPLKILAILQAMARHNSARTIEYNQFKGV
jgi:hypothetical protein